MSTTQSPVTVLTPLYITGLFGSPPGMARVAVAGEVDLATAPELRETLLGVLHAHGPAVFDIDLAGVRFLDCTGIGALVAVRNAAVHAGCQVRICHPQPIVRRVLEVTGLLDVFSVEPQPLTASPQHPPGRVPATVPAPRRLVAA
jgi:anti-anti-sigma factor